MDKFGLYGSPLEWGGWVEYVNSHILNVFLSCFSLMSFFLLFYGKLAILAYENKLKPDSLFLEIPGNKMTKPKCLFHVSKRSMKPKSIFQKDHKEPEHLDGEDDYTDEAEEDEIDEVKSRTVFFYVLYLVFRGNKDMDNFWATRDPGGCSGEINR